MEGSLVFHELRGQALEPWLDGLGKLRLTVFHEYPYLYDGTLEYERDYLRTYTNSPDSLVVLVTRDDEVVGATTCLPMRDEGPEFQEAFLKAGYDVEEICYFGESLLLPALRGRGIGREFFKRREAHVRALGLKYAAFCAVDRDPHHPLKPADYRPLDEFWKSQGYLKHPELQATFVWKERGEDVESPKTLTFWLKSWTRS